MKLKIRVSNSVQGVGLFRASQLVYFPLYMFSKLIGYNVPADFEFTTNQQNVYEKILRSFTETPDKNKNNIVVAKSICIRLIL